jgi:HEAT repeat protein
MVTDKLLVIGALTDVRASRATEIYREALSGTPILAGDAARLSKPSRAKELEDVILARLQKESDTYARVWLVGSLRNLIDKKTEAVLIAFAKVDDQQVSGVAFGVLQDWGSAAVPALSSVAKDGCDKCRESAVYLLMLNRLSPVPSLTLALNDANPRVRVLAAVALANAGNASGRAIMEGAAKTESDIGLRTWAAIRLASIGSPVQLDSVIATIKQSASNMAFVVRQVDRYGSPELRHRVLNLAKGDNREEVRVDVIGASRMTSEERTLVESAALSDTSNRTRLVAATKLLGDDRAMADDVLSSSFPNVGTQQQAMILDALAERGAATDIEKRIVNSGLTSSVAAVQMSALRGAGTLGEDAMPLLQRLLENGPTSIAEGAAAAMVTNSPRSAIRILQKELGSPVSHVRILSAGYLIRALELAR